MNKGNSLIYCFSSTTHAGFVHRCDCPGQPYIPIWLMVFGAVSLFHTWFSIMKLCGTMAAKKANEKEEEEEGHRNQTYTSRGGTTCESLLPLFLLIWTIVGSFWVLCYYLFTWQRYDCTADPSNDLCTCHPQGRRKHISSAWSGHSMTNLKWSGHLAKMVVLLSMQSRRLLKCGQAIA